MLQATLDQGVDIWFGTFLACAVATPPVALGTVHVARAQTAPATTAWFKLQLDEVYSKRRGRAVEFSIVFRDPLTRAYNPTLEVIESERVTIKLGNRTHSPRSFAIMGVKGADTPPVAAGTRTTLQFQAPARAACVYHDPGRSSLADARILFRDFIVAPRPGH